MRKYLLSLSYVIIMQLSALLVLMLLRLAIMWNSWEMLLQASRSLPMVLTSLLRGAWIDNTILSYASALPLLFFTVLYYLRVLHARHFRWAAVYYAIVHPLVFLASIVNIPYLPEFGALMNISAVEWLINERSVGEMILHDWGMLLCLILVIVLWVAYAMGASRLARAIGRRYDACSKAYTALPLTAPLSVLLLGLCFLGIRGGSLAGRAITVYPAFFTKDKVLSSVTVNPLFHMILSVKELDIFGKRRATLLDDDTLERCATEFWGKGTASHPLHHSIQASDSALFAGRQPNVVLILMEGISYYYMGVCDGGRQLTPFLDSLFQQSLHFTNCYSAGFRTNNGIMASLYSFPTYLERHSMRNIPPSATKGLPYEMGNMGYTVQFFATHGGDFDNVLPFLSSRYVQQVYAQEDYPKEKVANVWGVADDYLFEYAINNFNQQHESGKPFFATLLTITNHTPYVFPTAFKPKSADADDAIVEVADWHLRNFFANARRQPWYDNTVFILVADHGRQVKDVQSPNQDPINHIPLIIYAKDIQPREYTGVVSQMDIAPILLGLLGHGYEYENLSVDVLSVPRQYVTYSTLDMIKCHSLDRCFCYNVHEDSRHYYNISPQGSVSEGSRDAEFDRMERYCLSSFQLADDACYGAAAFDEPHSNNHKQ
ncbi:MAG: LTA synthase family protein [Prevotella sp.]|nr:LTA synthase family protein [Prevotella sp.]